MVEERRPKQPTYTSAKGVLGHPWLNKPDDKFAKPGEKGDYKTSIKVDAGAAAAAMAKCDELAKAKFDETVAELKGKEGGQAKIKKMKLYVPYEAVLDGEGDETGQIVFKSKVNAEGKSKATGETWSNKPPVFDAKGKPINDKVFSGSEGKISYQIASFYNAATGDAGVTLRLKAVQITKLVTSGAADASSYGFGAEEGYEGDDSDGLSPDAGTESPAAGTEEEVDF